MLWYTVYDGCLWFISDLSDLIVSVLLHESIPTVYHYKCLSAITLCMRTSGLIIDAVSIFYVPLRLLCHIKIIALIFIDSAHKEQRLFSIHHSIAVHYATFLYKIRVAYGKSGTVTLPNNVIAFVYISFCFDRRKHIKYGKFQFWNEL